ncbi:MAG: phosphoribosylformylglycinamidine synthase, purS [Caloramator sp.]|jgi:phosphoribosylformylglycinamidine synthase|uniref:phosphoribosylformylglycinamidine synthase subunit PurS n=1 Tax=unclassified Caloramator TaxID=2629145 RepID=UPI000418B97F|nr:MULTISPECIES: phosphoribosylformylglycinamidine synthase subunit PurS [unclassified Caloramator]MBZ4664237.1 phosphoribosylformylglycinamidine synthase, purS [Caloramator sp.]
MIKAYIDVTLKKSILDPQGTAVKKGLEKLSLYAEDVRIGKHIEVLLKEDKIEAAREKIDEMCRRLLVNFEVETYSVRFEVIE